MESQPQNPEFRINPENFHPFCHLHPTVAPAYTKLVEFISPMTGYFRERSKKQNRNLVSATP